METTNEQTPSQAENEKLFGRAAKAISIIKAPLHLYSFGLGQFVAYSLVSAQAAAYGIELTPALKWSSFGMGVILGLVIEWLHHEIPRPAWHLIFNLKHNYRNVGRMSALVVLLISIYGLTKLSQVMTSMGGEMGAAKMYVPPPPPDHTARVAAYRQDSASIAAGFKSTIAAINTKYDGEVSGVEAKYSAKIGKARARARGDRLLDPKVNSWAPGSARNFDRKALGYESDMAAAVSKVEARRAAELSPIQAEMGRTSLSLSQSLREDRAKVEMAYNKIVEDGKQKNLALQSLGHWSGAYVVWCLVLISFLLGAYDYARGKEYEGFAFNPAKRITRAWQAFSGIFEDKADHTINRLEATRTHLQTRNNARAFAMPSGRGLLIGGAVVGVGFFIVQTAVYSQSEYMEASIIPFPWNWVGLVFFLLLSFFVVKREAGKRQGLSSPLAAVPAPVSISSPPLSPVVSPPAPTVAPIIPKALPSVVSAKTIGSVGKLTVEIDGKEYTPKQAMDKMRKWYTRSKTSKTEKTRKDNRAKYDAVKTATKDYFNFKERGKSVEIEQK